MLKYIGFIILALAIGYNLVYSFILSQKYKKVKFNVEEEFKRETQQKIEEQINQEFEQKRKELDRDYDNFIEQYKNKKNLITQEIFAIEERRDLIVKHETEIIQSKLSSYEKLEQEKIKNRLAAFQDQLDTEYMQKVLKLDEEFESKKTLLTEELSQIQETLTDYRLRQETINQAILRDKERQEHESFYKINLTDQDKIDLTLLKEIEIKFHNREIFHKAAYDCYIKKPLLEMIKRVLNGKTPSGIYKITYIPTGEAYIGKSTDVAKRWTEHAKSVFGIGTIAHALVHTRMARDGIWNFTWELLEEAPKDKLTEREKYWIDFYGTKEMGMNEKGG